MTRILLTIIRTALAPINISTSTPPTIQFDPLSLPGNAVSLARARPRRRRARTQISRRAITDGARGAERAGATTARRQTGPHGRGWRAAVFVVVGSNVVFERRGGEALRELGDGLGLVVVGSLQELGRAWGDGLGGLDLGDGEGSAFGDVETEIQTVAPGLATGGG